MHDMGEREPRYGNATLTKGLEQQGHSHELCLRANSRKVFKSKHCSPSPHIRYHGEISRETGQRDLMQQPQKVCSCACDQHACACIIRAPYAHSALVHN